MLEKPLFSFQASPVAGQAAVAADDPVAGHDDRDGVVAVGGPDRASNDILPSLTLDFTLLSFRNENARSKEAKLWQAMMGESDASGEASTLPERIALFRQYQVDYLLLRGDPDWYLAMIEVYPQMPAYWNAGIWGRRQI